MDLDLAAFREARWERDSYLAVASLIFYEYLLQLGNEIDLFWKKRWSFGKCLFLWSRYYGLLYNIFNAVVFMQGHPSYKLCNTFFHWQNTGASLQMVTTHIILEVRLYAMYGNSKKILALLVFLIGAEATAMGIVFGIPNQKLIGTNNPFPGVFICADGDPLDGSHWVAYYWMAILIIESICLSLALYKAWTYRKSGQGGSLMRSLTRDSVVYFVLIFGIYLANLILWIQNRLTLNELGTGYSFVISSILANRLLITVRVNYYIKYEDRQQPHSSMQFASSVIYSTMPTKTIDTSVQGTSEGRTSDEGGGIELNTFNEQRGF